MRHFRPLRRLTAVVAQLLLVQLAFASGASACPLGGGAVSSREAAMTDASAPHGEHHPAAGAATTHDVASPASPHHSGAHCHLACIVAGCAAGGHCTVTATTQRTDEPCPDGATSGRVPTVSDAAPPSARAAPEPPPPRFAPLR